MYAWEVTRGIAYSHSLLLVIYSNHGLTFLTHFLCYSLSLDFITDTSLGIKA